MGHFSYTCQLSGLPITGGTPCVLLPMLPKARVYSASTENLKRFGVGSLVSNDGPNLYFDELSFPIFGEYNEYGGLENIIKDDNVKALEKYFSLPIDDIVECLLDGRKDQFEVDKEDGKEDQFGLSVTKAKLKFKKYPRQMFLVRSSATWYRKDVYDALVLKQRQAKRDYYDKLDIGVPGLLKALGFTMGNEKSKGRYNIPFTKDGLTIYSDGNWVSDKPGESNSFGVYHMKGLKDWCAKKNVEIDIEPFKNSTLHELIYDVIIPDITEFKSHDRWSSERVLRMLLGDEYLANYDPNKAKNYAKEVKRLKKEKEKNPVEFEKRFSTMDVIAFYERMLKDALEEGPKCSLPLLYFEMIKKSRKKNFLRKNIADWFIFKSFYYSTGRFLYPVGTSAQDGDHDRVLLLMQTATEILAAEVAERNEDRDDFDDEDDD